MHRRNAARRSFMSVNRRPLPETVALARGKAQSDQVSADAIIARTYARALFRALRARIGGEIAALFEADREGVIIADPAFDAADRLYRSQRIYVEPCMTVLPGQPLMYLVAYPDGTRTNVDEEMLLAMAGMA